MPQATKAIISDKGKLIRPQGVGGKVVLTKRSVFILALALLLCLSAVPLMPATEAASATWVVEGQMPEERSFAVWVELPDGKIFMAMGFNTTSMNDSWLFDPYGMEFTRLADADDRVVSSTGTYLAGKVYCFGGLASGFVSDVIIYDPSTDEWSTGPALPQTGAHMKSVAINERTILLVGNDGPGMERCYEYDIIDEEFRAVPDLPDGRAGGALVLMGTTVYYFGGWGAGSVMSDDIFSYDTVYKYWYQVGDLPSPRAGMAGVAGSDGLIYLLGGGLEAHWDGVNTADAIAWNPESRSFVDLPDLPKEVRYAAAFELSDGRIMYLGGNDPVEANLDVHSLQAWWAEVSLSSDTVGQGGSVWLSISVHVNFARIDGLYATAYLTAMGVTYATYDVSSMGSMAYVEIPVSEGLAPLGYVLVVEDLGYSWMQDFGFWEFPLNVTEAPSQDDRIDDLEQQNQDLQDRIDALQADLDAANADLREAVDAKLDAMIGYVILILVIVTLVVAVLVLLRKK